MANPSDHSSTSDDSETRRTTERQVEDVEYTPVIIKRTDEHLRHPDDALELAITEGSHQLERAFKPLLLSAICAGLLVGFSATSVAVVKSVTLSAGVSSELARLLVAAVYPVGFVLCVIGGAQLFTEHTATALYPWLDRKARFAAVVRLWSIVVSGNLLGTVIGSLLLASSFPVIDAQPGFVEVGKHLVHYDNVTLFASSVHAGWLMALGAWLICVCPRPTAQILVIYLVTFVIGLNGFHHSIAGSTELFAGMLASEEMRQVAHLRFIPIALLGNLVGGSLLVALLNYACVRKLDEPEQADE